MYDKLIKRGTPVSEVKSNISRGPYKRQKGNAIRQENTQLKSENQANIRAYLTSSSHSQELIQTEHSKTLLYSHEEANLKPDPNEKSEGAWS